MIPEKQTFLAFSLIEKVYTKFFIGRHILYQKLCHTLQIYNIGSAGVNLRQTPHFF